MGTVRDRCLPYPYLLGRTTKMKILHTTHFGYLVIPNNNAIPTERKTPICTERDTAKRSKIKART